MIDQTALSTLLQHLLPQIQSHNNNNTTTTTKPFILGLSGLQGSGKSTWATALADALTYQHGINTRTLSLDDLYMDHAELVALRKAHPDNKLLHKRGQPGTHDEELARRFFDDVMTPRSTRNENTTDVIRWPAFDKSLHNGEGGRVPIKDWTVVPREPALDLVIFEGWCLGFGPLEPGAVEQRWQHAVDNRSRRTDSADGMSTQTLADHKLEDLLLINDNLARYRDTFMGPWRFDAFVHLSTENLRNVYSWRLDQERALRISKGGKSGMTDEKVIEFVQGYMPAYELYLDELTQKSLFASHESFGPRLERGGKLHLQVVLDAKRTVCSIEKM
jgi:D-glycerate 3-kinase